MAASAYETYTAAVVFGQGVSGHKAFVLTKSLRDDTAAAVQATVPKEWWIYQLLSDVTDSTTIPYALPAGMELWAYNGGTIIWLRIRTAADVTDAIPTDAPDGSGTGVQVYTLEATAIAAGIGIGADFGVMAETDPIGRTSFLLDSLLNLINDSGGLGKVAISTSSVADPSVIATASPHGLITDELAIISGHGGSTPSIDGSWPATVLTDTTFSIPVNVTVGGTGGHVTYTGIETRIGASLLLPADVTLYVENASAGMVPITA